MKYPKYMIRPDDREKFIHLGNGKYSLEFTLKMFPNHLHSRYKYQVLKRLGFIPQD